ncbi:MAG TPA: hypothetical protein VGQ33_22040, partial [Vicinamibacteria bacterium]|nr:hypothetical protein [Vicinamibacteria bacterium]
MAEEPSTTRNSVVALQPFRKTTRVSFPGRDDAAQTVTLVELNPHANAWFLLRVERAGEPAADYHLENADPAHRRFHLDARAPGLVIDSGRQHATCDLWSGGDRSALALARASGRTYAPLCGDRLFLRNPTDGHRTYKEWAADFLRDHVWRGDRITAFVKDSLLRDSAMVTSGSHRGAEPAADPAAPAAALVEPAVAGEDVDPVGLGLRLDGAASGLDVGRWYRVHGTPGVFASVLQPGRVTDAVPPVKPLDPIESDALVYSVAFDLADFDLGFALGTDHPRVDWSERSTARMDEGQRPGPDGIGSVAPLVRTGRINPVDAGRVAATFIGGFKRIHGAFREGPLAKVNDGSHYGFV